MPSSTHSQWTTDSGSDDEELAIEAKRALAYLQTHRNYRYVEFLAQGGYGWVSLVYDDENDRQLAVKCTSESTEMELSWWPRLRHKNILELLEHITLDNCTVFIMPAMRKDLWTVVNESSFYQQELSFGLCRIWLKDLAYALEYLHRQFLCHLDLKLDNVFIKQDGHACLGDFSLLSDIREVPQAFHFLKIYEPPEYTDWCHTKPPDSIANATVFGGDKADMWQYGILAIDLLTDMKLSHSDSNHSLTLWHHDIWPLIEKILLHEDYLCYLLESTFTNVIFEEDDIQLCHNFLENILCLEPDKRISAEAASGHFFCNIPWPKLPMEFTLPTVIVEHKREMKPLPGEELDDPNLTIDDVLATVEEEPLPEAPSIGALDVMKRKMKKMQKEKMVRRESIAVEAGKKPLVVKKSLKDLRRKPTPYPKKDSDEPSKKTKIQTKETANGRKIQVKSVKQSHVGGAKLAAKQPEKKKDSPAKDSK